MSEEKYLTVPFECDRQKVRPITYQGSLSELLNVHQVCQIKEVGTEEVSGGEKEERGEEIKKKKQQKKRGRKAR